MGQDPAEIREEIAQTREDMGQTVDALGHKADVKGRVAGYVTDKKDALMGTASENMPDGAAVKEKGRRVGRPPRKIRSVLLWPVLQRDSWSVSRFRPRGWRMTVSAKLRTT